MTTTRPQPIDDFNAWFQAFLQPTVLTELAVLAGTASGGGAALIAVDGKPPKPFRVGASVDDGLVLQSLNRREARLGPAPTGDSTLTLVVPLKP